MNYMKLRALRESAGWTQAEAARRIGISAQSYGHYEHGKREPDLSMISRIALAFGVEVRDLMETEKKSDSVALQFLQQQYLRWIPVFESVSAGFGVDAQNRVTQMMPISIESNSEAERTICIKVCGDSMYPKIEDGDIIQVLKQNTAENGDVVVILDGDEAFVKKFIKGKSGVILESLNPSYPPRKYTKTESNELRIVGIVKSVIRKF